MESGWLFRKQPVLRLLARKPDAGFALVAHESHAERYRTGRRQLVAIRSTPWSIEPAIPIRAFQVSSTRPSLKRTGDSSKALVAVIAPMSSGNFVY